MQKNREQNGEGIAAQLRRFREQRYCGKRTNHAEASIPVFTRFSLKGIYGYPFECGPGGGVESRGVHYESNSNQIAIPGPTRTASINHAEPDRASSACDCMNT